MLSNSIVLVCACHSATIRIPFISKSYDPASLNDQYESCPTFTAGTFRLRIRCCNLSMISATYRAAKTYFIFPVFHKNASKRSINHCHPAGKGKVSPVDELLLQLQKKCPVRLIDQYSVSYLSPPVTHQYFSKNVTFVADFLPRYCLSHLQDTGYGR